MALDQRFDGNAARQLTFEDDPRAPIVRGTGRTHRPGASRLSLLQKDVYAELTRRRRRAQIAARHLLDRPER